MSASWQALHNQDRSLALCLLFAPAKTRPLLADRLSLALEAELAIRVTSEPMLAAIRLQWWSDALETGRHENVPLAERLLAHIGRGHLDPDAVHAQLALWQDRLGDDTFGADRCWHDFFGMLAEDRAAEPAASLVGAALRTSQHADRLDDGLLADLRTPHHYWIWMIGQLARHEMSAADGTDDPLLIWKMLGWRCGFRLPSRPTTP
ncbi:hypothetical protein AB3X55_02720 [Alphaproteobacteria bacterium LSUCC0719]